MTDQDLKDMMAQLVSTQAETARGLRESKEETTRFLRESKEENDRQLRKLGKQLGGLGEKFGSFAEGMALPSMTRLLEKRFGLNNIAPRYRVKKGGRTLELDVFGFSNTDRNIAVVVEVKSRLREEGVDQLLRILRDFPTFLPQHRDKQLFGIVAAVDVPEELAQRVWREGLYLARISDETFTLQVPDDFVPRSFQDPVVN